MKLTIQYHAGNPNMCRIPELTVRQMPECEGGGWWLPRAQAGFLVAAAEFVSGCLCRGCGKPTRGVSSPGFPECGDCFQKRESCERSVMDYAPTEPVAWRARVKSDDPEEWSLLPAGAGADYLRRPDYEIQPLFPSPAPRRTDKEMGTMATTDRTFRTLDRLIHEMEKAEESASIRDASGDVRRHFFDAKAALERARREAQIETRLATD